MRKFRVSNSDIRQSEAGMVSIIITVILMAVISITVLGFSQVIRKSQQQALDHQLSSQAFYAAESGINDAKKLIEGFSPTNIPTKTECGRAPASSPYYPLTGVIDATANIRYTCLLVDGTPDELSYDLSTTSSSKVVPIKVSTGIINALNLSWTAEPAFAGNPTAGCDSHVGVNLPKLSSWTCGYGMIRLDLVPATSFGRNALMANTFTAFISPTRAATSDTLNYESGTDNLYGGSANQGAHAGAHCDGANCSIRLSGLSGNEYYMRVSTLYKNTTLNISTDSGAPLVGAQVVIDATGKAQDVVRRIKVSVPLSGNGSHSDYGLETTGSICKNFSAGKAGGTANYPYPGSCN